MRIGNEKGGESGNGKDGRAEKEQRQLGRQREGTTPIGWEGGSYIPYE
jgi:hypothetical protein